MNKKEFLNELEKRLNGLPKADIDEKIEFFSEMIDDKCTDGNISEDEAVASLGSIDEIVSDIVKDTSLLKIVSQKIKPKRRLRAIEIILLIVGFPLWFPLLLVTLLLLLVFCLVMWIFAIATYAIEVAALATSVAGFMAFLQTLAEKNMNIGYLGISMAGLGFALAFIIVCVIATKLDAKLTKGIVVGIKRALVGKR